MMSQVSLVWLPKACRSDGVAGVQIGRRASCWRGLALMWGLCPHSKNPWVPKAPETLLLGAYA